MENTERIRLQFLHRMALSHLTFCDIKEKTRTFEPTTEVPSLEHEYALLEKLINEVKNKLKPLEP